MVEHVPCTIDQYHARPEWSHSQLVLLPESPELFRARHVTRELSFPATAPMELGQAVHDLLSGSDNVVLIPAEALTSNGQRRGKAWEQFCAQHDGSMLLKEDTYNTVRRIADALHAEPIAGKLLAAAGHTEHTVVWQDGETGLPLRMRCDKAACFPDGWVLVDWKVVSDPTERAFQYKIEDFAYHRQAAFYSDGWTLYQQSPEAFVFVAVRGEPPHEVRCWELAARALYLGRQQNDAAKRDLARRLEQDDWHGAGHGRLVEIDLPARNYRD